jgi:transposase
LEARLLELEGIVRDLMDRVKQLTSPPPPRPPSELPAGPAKKPTGRKAGGQKGHPPLLKTFVPPERVRQVIPFVPERCSKCQARLRQEAGPNDPLPTRHQVAELPPVAAEITEYQGHFRTCRRCGHENHTAIPADIRRHSVGPRFTATLSYLSGCHGLSKRGVEEIAAAVFDAPIALGTVANLEQEMSAALAPAHQQALEAMRKAPVKHVDETGWKQAGHKRWLWVAATGSVVVFLIQPWRNLQALKRLVGAKFRGILCSDRWRVYDEWPLKRRQVCWAHVKRNWEKLAERGGKAKIVAEACLGVQKRVFELWHLYRGGGCTHDKMDEGMTLLFLELAGLLRAGYRSRDRKLARFCQRLAAVYPALWTFLDGEVEPTNNHAERVQRRAVLWRRRSFGTHSAAGSRYVERILTVVQTLRLQQRSVLTYLTEALQAHRSSLQPPAMLAAE